jgi:hypothetical protein
MKHINFKLTNFPFVPLMEDFIPLPPPPIITANRILPDGTYRIYVNLLAEVVNRIVDIEDN